MDDRRVTASPDDVAGAAASDVGASSAASPEPPAAHGSGIDGTSTEPLRPSGYAESSTLEERLARLERWKEMDEIRAIRRARRVRRNKFLAVLLFGALGVVAGLGLGLGSLKSSQDLSAEMLRESAGPEGGIVQELLGEPAVQEMLRGERAEAAASRNR